MSQTISEVKVSLETTPTFNFQIVNGYFAADDAEEIISGLLQVKKDYHLNRISNVPGIYEETIKHSEQRIKEVEETLRKAIDFIQQAALNDRLLDIEGTITLKFADS